MTDRILVTYATCFGSTQEIADSIAARLRDQGVAVDLRPMADVDSLDGYRAALLGSAVQHGAWLPEALAFAETHQQALRRMPVALFTVHTTNLGNDAASQRNRRAFLDSVRPLVQPVTEVYFAGKFDRRGAALLLPPWAARFIPTLDWRKWKAIHAWADDVPALLLAAQPGPVSVSGEAAITSHAA